MSKKFNIREWVLSVKYWSLLFIPHISICIIFLIYILIGASILQEIESEELENILLIKNFQRERLLTKIIEKRQTYDLQQFTKYVYRHVLQYEDEIKKQFNFEENSSWNFSKSLFFISTTLTTISSNDFIPKKKIGKLFLIFYTGFGIPLTLVFLTDLSYLIKKLIKCISMTIFYFYSSKYFLPIRRFEICRFIEKQFLISNEEEDFTTSLSLFQHLNYETDLTMIQLMLTLFIYILLGTYFIPSKSFSDSFYLCFTMIFTINLNKKIIEEKNLFFTITYLFFGLAIVLLCIKAVQIRIEILLSNVGKKFLGNLLEFAQQIGFRDLPTDDLLATLDKNSPHASELITSQHRHLMRTKSLEHQPNRRPVGIAEPLRRLSTGFIRVLKNNDNDGAKTSDKGVQVSTIIRRCGRCADTRLPILPVRKHNAISTSSSSLNDSNSSCEDDDIMEFPPPNLDRIRQRRATLVAKTILTQLASQSRSSFDDQVAPLTFLSTQRSRTMEPPSALARCSVIVSAPTSPAAPRKQSTNEIEFSDISKQISALLVPSDDDN